MSTRIALAAALAALLGIAAACSDDDPAATPTEAPADDADGGGGPAYTGPAQGGLYPDRDGSPDFLPIDAGTGTVDAPVECCQTTFSLADGTSDETVARLRGDLEPLDGEGLALTYSGGKWTASACIPVGEHVRYRFFFGQVREDPENDASALVDDNRYDPARPTEADGNGSFVNTVTRTSGCSE